MGSYHQKCQAAASRPSAREMDSAALLQRNFTAGGIKLRACPAAEQFICMHQLQRFISPKQSTPRNLYLTPSPNERSHALMTLCGDGGAHALVKALGLKPRANSFGHVRVRMGCGVPALS